VENFNLAGAPGAIVNGLLVALVSPVDDTVKLYGAASVNERLLNVAVPFTALAGGGVTPEGFEVKLTRAVEAVRLPLASRTCTATEAIGKPAVPLAGCTLKASLAGAPGEIVKELLVAPVSPVEAALNVYGPTAVSTTLNVATPPAEARVLP
jgi:hypothetical protein